MAENPLPLTELIKINDQNVADIDGISDLLQDAPFLAAVLATEASNGTQHKYLKETKAPVVGFRSPNNGREHDSSEDTLVSIDLKILDATFHADQAVADEFDTKPYGMGRDAFMAREAQRHIRAAFAKGELQLINGTADDADGFTGLRDASTIDAVADPMVVDAGGASVDATTSVYLIRSVPQMTDFLLVSGDGGKIKIGDEFQQNMSGATGTFPAYVQPIYTWLGIQLGSIYSVGRIANLDGTATLNDDLISQAISAFPASRGPTHLVMNRQSLSQLQQSRTATNTTGAPAPFPMESFGVPIVVTDSVLNTEPVLT